MTGFGRGEFASPQMIARVEITSVNRKQADIVLNLPRELNEIESSLKKMVLGTVSRGRANVSIKLENVSTTPQAFKIDFQRAQSLENSFTELSTHLKRTIEPQAQDFLRIPGLFNFDDAEVDPEAALCAIEPALEQALERLNEMRKAEGLDLKIDLLKRLDILEGLSKMIESDSPGVMTRYRENLHQRLRESEIEVNLDDERLLKEVAIFAERCDISEEITRLASHLKRFRNYLDQEEAVGRSLDFLCQEINREFNTIGSKANDATIAQNVVNAKTELEKIREQVQNIE